MSQKRAGCFAAILAIALFVSVILNFSFVVSRSISGVKGASPPKPGTSPFNFGETVVKTPIPDKEGNQKRIAVISLRGVISTGESGQVEESSLEDTIVQIQQTKEDETIAAVVLRIDSPGGEVTASDMLYEEVRKLREQKPVVVSMDAIAASGGYYVACAGSYLFAHETTITASIGVIMQALNYQELLGKVGLEVHTFKSGAFKDLLNGARSLTEEEKQYVQAMIFQSYDRFVGIVAKERRIPEQELRTGVADGRIVSGKEALGYRLIDQVGGFDDALEKARSLANVPGAAAIRFTAPVAFGRLLRFLSETPTRGGRLEVGLGHAPQIKLENGRLYYLPSILAP